MNRSRAGGLEAGVTSGGQWCAARCISAGCSLARSLGVAAGRPRRRPPSKKAARRPQRRRGCYMCPPAKLQVLRRGCISLGRTWGVSWLGRRTAARQAGGGSAIITGQGAGQKWRLEADNQPTCAHTHAGRTQARHARVSQVPGHILGTRNAGQVVACGGGATTCVCGPHMASPWCPFPFCWLLPPHTAG